MELRECPFCGKVRLAVFDEVPPFFDDKKAACTVICMECGARGPRVSEGAAQDMVAEGLWNQRAADAEIAELREQVAKLREFAQQMVAKDPYAYRLNGGFGRYCHYCGASRHDGHADWCSYNAMDELLIKGTDDEL